MTSPASSTRGWIGPYLALAVLWGCSFLFIALALQTFAPTQVAFGRIVIGFVLLAVILLIRRERVRLERSRIGDFVLVGTVMTAIPFVLFALAEQRVTSVLAGLVNATTPLFTAVFVALLLPTERPDRVQVSGLLIGFGGIAVLLGIWNSGAIDLVGGVMLLGATFCYGLGNAWSRRRLTSTGPVERGAARHPAGRRRTGDPAVRGLHAPDRRARRGTRPGAARARARRDRVGVRAVLARPGDRRSHGHRQRHLRDPAGLDDARRPRAPRGPALVRAGRRGDRAGRRRAHAVGCGEEARGSDREPRPTRCRGRCGGARGRSPLPRP